MVAIPEIITEPTLAAIDQAIVDAQDRYWRHHLGMSQIGHKCERKLWYDWRWATRPNFDAATLKRFEDGHRTEDLVASRLRMVDGITLITVDPEKGHQIQYTDHGGHFGGSMDGAILGLLEAPKTWHVWECKASSKGGALQKAKMSEGEKAALRKWNEVYYAQAVLYMDYSGMTRHFLTCDSPGGRESVSVRTDADPGAAMRLKAKAKKIIDSPIPLARITENPAHWECKWCDHHGACFGDRLPEVHCRTCVHSTPEMDGDGRWSCARHKGTIPKNFLQEGCDEHLYIPALLEGYVQQVDASPEENWVEYENPETKATIRNGPRPGYSSYEIKVFVEKQSIGLAADPDLQDLRSRFNAVVTG